MSERVDVLAVMDDAHNVLGEVAFKYRRKIGPFATQAVRPVHMLPKARAAVAELTEAAQWADVALHDYPCEARDKLRAALARIGAGIA